MMKKFAYLRYKMATAGYDCKTLAEELGISRQKLYHMLSGYTPWPLDLAFNCCELLGMGYQNDELFTAFKEVIKDD